MIANQWLESAVQLLEYREEQPLLQCFMRTLSGALSTDTLLLFSFGEEGRTLQLELAEGARAESLGALGNFGVDDFSHPFSHLLQSATPMQLEQDALAYWREHPGFRAIGQLVSTKESLLSYPLREGRQAIAGVLCLVLDRMQVSRLCTQQSWHQYVALFTHHWSMLRQIKTEHAYQARLSDSLSDMQQRQQEACMAERLAGDLLGQSGAMSQLRQEIVKAARSGLSVLVQGETGTGKELVARAIHELSDRRDQPFVAINCTAIPENLLESELFGYSKGAFSGADRSRRGLIDKANGGTLFLDEIGDMPPSLQSKLLRVLETGRYRPLGSLDEQHSNFRLVSATHVNLQSGIENGSFRRDLYYRLSQFPIHLPALRTRLDDITQLAEHFIGLFNSTHARKVGGICTASLARLRGYHFPGNVRELRNLLEYACARTMDGNKIEPSDLPLLEQPQLPKTGVMDSLGQISDLRIAVAEFEREVIRDRLRICEGDRGKAARSLGLPRRTFSHKCQKLEISD